MVCRWESRIRHHSRCRGDGPRSELWASVASTCKVANLRRPRSIATRLMRTSQSLGPAMLKGQWGKKRQLYFFIFLASQYLRYEYFNHTRSGRGTYVSKYLIHICIIESFVGVSLFSLIARLFHFTWRMRFGCFRNIQASFGAIL